ncbi:MAG: hypothetical protein MRY79_09350 [Alphaproteobacteria bacterium]|nr:hypothetical protein [Alphaproteobacteria bacterium]
MITYMKLGRVRGLSIEIKRDFGARPFFRKNTFHYETIVDIPYAQITYTSSKWIPLRSAANVNEKAQQTKKRSGGT